MSRGVHCILLLIYVYFRSSSYVYFVPPYHVLFFLFFVTFIRSLITKCQVYYNFTLVFATFVLAL